MTRFFHAVSFGGITALRGSAAAAAFVFLGATASTAAPVDVSDRIEVVAANPKTTLDRATGRTVSTIDIRLTNKGTRPIEAPLHAVVFFTAQNGTLEGLQVTGASGGLGVAPYQTFFYDLSSAVTQPFAPGASTSFVLRFSPPRGTQVSYRIAPFGVLNQDPVANAGGPYAAQVGEAISFSSASSSDPDGDALTVSWNFGDGTAANTERSPTHAFGATGVFEVTLTVRDPRGGLSTARVPAVISPAEEFGLARVRTLDGGGLPLAGVDVAEKLGAQTMTFATDATTGYSSLGRGPGNYIWKFSKTGYLDVWRSATITPNTVAIVPNPWLAQQSAVSTAISPISDAQLTATGVVIDFPGGSFEQPTTAILTAVPAQALPFPLPAGWSPLSQFHLQTSSEPAQPGAATLTLAGSLNSGEEAAFVKFDAASLQWQAVALVSGGTSVNAPVASSGSFAVVVRDQGARAPPAPVVGEAIQPTSAPSDIFGISASGSVTPAVSSPSRDAAQVTALARIVFSNPTALSSGLFFRTLVRENYALLDGSTTRAPEYDTTVFAYQRPGDALAASFPMRPQLLLGPDELMEATVRAEVLEPGAFAGGVIGAAGGQLGSGEIRIIAPAGALPALQATELATLDAQSFTGLTGGIVPSHAFALNIGALAPGHPVTFDFGTLEPNGFYVLGRAIWANGVIGVTPIERFASDAEGRLTSSEPQTGERLPGARGSGEYVLLKVAGPLALVHGTAADTSGSPSGGLIVQVAGQPWVMISGADGSYRTLLPVGTTQVTVTDPRDGNQGFASVTVTDPSQSHEASVTTAPTGPRVVSLEPAAGATTARTVTPVVVRFSERILPASFGANGVVLRAADGSVVPGALSLNSAATVATLLPTNPLAPEAVYTIEVSAAITDATHLPLEGERVFTFTTAPLAARGDGGQVVIYEPGATNIPQEVIDMIPAFTPEAGSSIVVAHGNQGTADAEVPVILVNLNSGETSTVLSKPDGSFAGFINGSEEEFVSAVFVNANGTRIEIPATRQLFDDGQVGLYRHGGILEAESDNGPVQVIVEPEAIPNRTKFKVEFATVSALLAELQNTLPEDGKLLGGVRVNISGDALQQAADVRFPVDEEDLEVPPGETPEEGVYALCEKIEFEGVVQFGVVDKMEFEGGALVTKSPPYPGVAGQAIGNLLYMPVRLAFGAKATIVGRAVTATAGATVTEDAILAGAPPILPQAGVVVHATIGGDTDTSGRLRPGAFVARTNRAGFFALIVPADVFNPTPIVLRGFSPRFPGLTARNVFTPRPLSVTPGEVPIVTANLVFNLPAGAASVDNFAPLLTARTNSAILPILQDTNISIEARDDQSTPMVQVLEYLPNESTPLVSGETLGPSDVVLTQQATVIGGGSIQIPFTLLVRKAALIAVRVKVVDAAGNERDTTFKFRYGTAPPLGGGDDPPPSDDEDRQPPSIFGVSPASESLLTQPQAVLFFSERVRRADLEAVTGNGNSSVVSINPNGTGPAPVRVELGPEGTSAVVRFSGLQPATDYTATVVTGGVRDLNGNFMKETFVWTFRTADEIAHQLNGITQAVASVVSGPVIVSIGRDNGGVLVTHRVGDTDSLDPLGTLSLPDFPRALTDIGMYSFKRTPEGQVERRRLVAATGGIVGEGSVGPWLWVIDVTDPTQPTRLASSLVTADFASAASILKWDPPYMMAGILTFEQSFIFHVNLQAFILGSNGLHDVSYRRGVDLNGDGDFVDPGEQLPVPERLTLFGLELPTAIQSGRPLVDFDSTLGGSVLVAALGGREGDQARLAVLTFQGFPIDDGTGPAGVVPLSNPNIRRVMLDLDFPVRDPGGVRNVPVAVTVRGDLVEWWDLTIPSGPVALTRTDGAPVRFHLGELVPGATSIFSISRSGPAEYSIATPAGLFVFDRARLGDFTQPFEVTFSHADAPMAGGRTFGGSSLAFSTSSGVVRVINRAPELAVVRFPGTTPQAIAAIPPTDEEALRNLLGSSLEQAFLQPVIFPETPGEAPEEGVPPLSPADPLAHHYVRVRAAGALGPTLRVAAESLDTGGNLNAGLGPDYPPVLLSGLAGDVGYGATVQPAVTAITLRRLSNDPNSDLYNDYLSGPLVVVRERLSDPQRNALGEVADRVALWSGTFLRFAIDASNGAADQDLALWQSEVSNGQFIPGVARTYFGWPAEYVDTPNPSPPRLAPVIAGVDLQSGEFTAPEVDWHLEGRHQDLMLQRVYQSRSKYIGPFGRGWDHNYNARIMVLPEALEPGTLVPLPTRGGEGVTAEPGDVLLIDGAGSVLFYRKIAEERNNLERKPLYASDPALAEFYGLNAATDKVKTFYDSPAGIFSILVQLKDGSFVQIAPSGHRTLFRPDGKLDRLIGAFEKSELVLQYRPDGLLDRVVGDRGLDLLFGYYFPFLDRRRIGTTDEVSEDPLLLGRVARVECSSSLSYDYEVEYEYDNLGRLSKITPNLGKETVLTWDPNQPDLLIRVGTEDGTGPPAVTVGYNGAGLANSVSMGGSSFSTGGAVATSRQRFAEPGSVTLTPGGGNPVAIELDAQGAPKGFGGRELTADAATGLPTRFDSPEQRVVVEYDSNNPVYRFRGNLLETRRGEPQSEVVTTSTFDGSAWNRPKDTVTADGVTTTRTYTDSPTGGLEARETTGPVTKRIQYNEYGQIELEEQSSGGTVEWRTTHGLGSQGADVDLPTRSSYDTESVIRRDVFGRPEFNGKTGGLGWTMRYKSGTGEIEAQLPSVPVVPSTTYGYDGQLRLQSETVNGGTAAVVSTYAYEDARFPGRVTLFTQTETGLPSSSTQYGYNANGQLDTLTVDGETTSYAYDGALNTGLTGPGVVREVVYAAGRQLESVTENGVTASFTYDGSGRVETSESRGAKTTFIYDTTPTGGVSERVVGKTVVDTGTSEILVDETWEHDAAGRLHRVISPLSGRTREFTYFADASLRSNTINGQVVREVSRDTSGHLTFTRLNNLNIAFSNYHAGTGKPQREVLTFLGSTGGTTTIDKTFDAIGRPLTQTAGGVPSSFDWDQFGNLTSHTDGDAVLFGQTASPTGLPLLITFTDGSTATHSYDAHRRRQSIGTATGTIGFDYDSEGFVRLITYPDGTTSQFQDRNNFFEAETVIHGDVVQMHSYDDAGRLAGIDVPDTGDSLGFAFDGLGRRTSVTLNDLSLGFGYTPGGAANGETIEFAGADLGSWEQELNALDHVLGESYPTGGFAVSYNPDTFGQPQQVGGAGVDSVTWKAAGLPDELRYGAGLIVRHEYDAALRLTGVRYEGLVDNQPTLAGYRVDLTVGGRVLHEERLHEERFDIFTRNGPGEAMRITDFTFGAENDGGTNPEATISGIAFQGGEISTPSQQSNPALTGPDPRGFFPEIVRAPGGSPRVATIAGQAVDYDTLGSMTSFPIWVVLPGQSTWTQIAATATYDGLGNIKTINRADGVTITYTRDGLGRIFERDVDGPPGRCLRGKTRYRWKGQRLIEEHEQPAGALQFTLTRRYIWLDSRLALVQAASAPGAPLIDFVPLVSINGSVGGFVTPAGEFVETINYSAYGVPYVRSAGDGVVTATGRSAIGPTVLFQGAWYDDQSGLYQVGQRTLHPFAGIFLQRDSALYSESLAWFTAFNGDPAGRQDPTGTLSDRQKELIAFAEQNKALYDAAKEIHEPLTGLVKAIGDGDPLEIAGSLTETANKTIGLCTTTSDEDVKDRYKLITDSLDTIKTGVEVLQAVNGIRKDRELLKAISVFTGAGGSGANTSLRNLARLGAGASPSDVRDSILELSGDAEVHNRAIQVRGKPQSAAKFYHEQRSAAAARRKEHLGKISTGVHTLGRALVSQYLADDEAASRLANQFIASSEANFELANAVTDVLGSKKLSRYRLALNPLRPKRALASIRSFALNSEARSAVSVSFTAGFELGKLAIIGLNDDDVAQAYEEQVKQFEANGGYLTVFGGVLSTFGFDDSAFKVQQLADVRSSFGEGFSQGLQMIFDENRRAVQRRETYLNGISEP